jgi:cytochrome c556
MKSSVLQDSDQFKKAVRSFQQETGNLVSAAKAGDLDAAKVQFGKVAKSCKECHGQYRK